MAPLSQQRAGALVGFLADGLVPVADPSVLDVGRGWVELLLQVLHAVPSATGTGVDADPGAIAHGRGEVLQRAARQRSAHFGGYRGVLGLAHLGLLAV